jgi:hypothetical protein
MAARQCPSRISRKARAMNDSAASSTAPISHYDATRPAVPPLWVSYYHVIYTAVFCLAGMIVPLSLVRDMQPLDFLMIPVTCVLANVIEYVIHRWPMHRRYPYAGFMMDLHMLHHRYFFEENYRIDSFADFGLIVFPPIVLNILAFGVCPGFFLAAWWLIGWNAALLFFATVMGYYLAMQLIHVATHARDDHWVLDIPGIRYLWNHHQIHHSRRMMTKVNFNFIIPLTDLLVGTATQEPSSAETVGSRS